MNLDKTEVSKYSRYLFNQINVLITIQACFHNEIKLFLIDNFFQAENEYLYALILTQQNKKSIDLINEILFAIKVGTNRSVMTYCIHVRLNCVIVSCVFQDANLVPFVDNSIFKHVCKFINPSVHKNIVQTHAQIALNHIFVRIWKQLPQYVCIM